MGSQKYVKEGKEGGKKRKEKSQTEKEKNIVFQN